MYHQRRNDNEERRARLACFVLYLFPNIMQCYLSHYIHKKGLSNKYCNNKRNPPVLTPSELLLVKELPNVQNFTIQLCYKLISFEGLLPTPSSGWGQFPDHTALKIADDIERIRHVINAIRAMNNDDCTENYLVKLLYRHDRYKLEQIIRRFRIALGNKSVFQTYKSLLIQNIDTAVVLTEFKNVGIIECDAPHIILQDRERYSKISAVINEFFPKILQNLIPSFYSPLHLYNMCTQHGRNWDKSQTLQINKLQSNFGYTSLDASLLYQLFRTFSFVPNPTQGWGQIPAKRDTNIADDIEQIRLLRNECAHRCDTCIDPTVFDNYFLQFREITHRIAADYEHELTAIARESLDSKRQIDLEIALQELVDIKEQFQMTPLRFYWGNDMAMLIKDIRQRIQREKDILGQEKFLIEIELINIDDAEMKAKILNEARTQINEVELNIEFVGALTGCLVLYAYIRTETLATDDILQTELSSFMTRILKKGKFGITSTQWIDAVICPSEGNKKLELDSSIAKSLKLQFNVKMDVFETDVSLESEIGACMQRTIKNLNGKGFNEEVTAIVRYVQSEDTEETHAMETNQLIQVDKIVEMEKEGTIDKVLQDRSTNKLSGQRPLKWTIPIDLQRQAEKLQKTVTRTTGSLLLTPIVCDGYVIDSMIDRRLIDSQNIRRETHTGNMYLW
ncbi:uncharacterized protein LOC127736829 [Mytilus californianus]|uniref:uncharacterized protein LOC127736829 n=1 Tax=Mytilus californianus TaxID=6549 RepID=UPI00224823A7|nr:uncharacterized protein LOC127736829 [Mytilus californianus]